MLTHVICRVERWIGVDVWIRVSTKSHGRVSLDNECELTQRLIQYYSIISV